MHQPVPLASIAAASPRWILAVAVVAMAAWTASTETARATGGESPATVTPEETDGGGLYIPTDDGRYMPVPLVSTEIDSSVSGLVARTVVRHRFRNPSDDWIEAVYVFPLPQRSAVDQLRMIIGERVIEGHIEERQQAKRTYEKARAAGARAGLVEQERPNIFTSSIANIGPGEEVSVEIGFQETLRFESGAFRMRLPLVVGPRYIPRTRPVAGFGGTGWAVNTDQVPDAERITPPVRGPLEDPGNPVSLTVDLDTGFPIAGVTSPDHSLAVVDAGIGRRTITLAAGPVPAERDLTLEWRPRPGNEPTAGLFEETIDGSRFLLLMLMPRTAGDSDQATAREVVFVIDTSGSMHGTSIEQAKSALHLALDRLRPTDTFNIIQFNNHASALFASAQPATTDAIALAHRHIVALTAEGGTEMMAGLRLALDGRDHGGRVRQVVLMTDGAVGNESALFAHIAAELGGSRLFTVGIGSAPNGHFMAGAARVGRGSHLFIGDLSRVEEQMNALLRKLERPAMTDIRLAWPAAHATETFPLPVPDLYAGEPLMVVARLPDDAVGETVDVAGRVGSKGWRTSVTLKGGRQRPGIARLWAREKIRALGDSVFLGADPAEVREAIVRTAIAHHLVSRHTSLVAVDATPVRPQETPPATRPVPTNMPAGWSHEHVFGEAELRKAAAPTPHPTVRLAADTRTRSLAGLPQTATPASLYAIVGFVAILLAVLLFAFARFSGRAAR